VTESLRQRLKPCAAFAHVDRGVEYPSGGPRSPGDHADALAFSACEASLRPSRRREASRC
jgi:hypothetical protein